jgi:DNA invertase Pin-like site-specific DNA recombinase
MKAIAYIRVSTAKQANEGVSLEAQQARITAWAVANDAELIAVHVDAGISGAKTSNRPALQAALNDACQHQAALVVYSLSRLARSTKDAINISERLSAAGADLVSLSEKIDTTSAAGKMVFRMLAVLAEFERDLISERTSTAMQHKISKGEYIGGRAAYGWQTLVNGGGVEANDTELTIIHRARQLRASGLALRAVGVTLEQEGHRPRLGGRWHAKTVQGLLRRTA